MVPRFMAQRMGVWSAAAVAVVVVGIGWALIVSGRDESGSGLPRVRVPVPGVDNDVDLFANESEPNEEGERRTDVIEVDSIDQIQAAFDADVGHPRLVLLIDPI